MATKFKLNSYIIISILIIIVIQYKSIFDTHKLKQGLENSIQDFNIITNEYTKNKLEYNSIKEDDYFKSIERLENIYGVDTGICTTVVDKVELLYENRIYYDVLYRLDLISIMYDITYNNKYKDYSNQIDTMKTEIMKFYMRYLNNTITTSNNTSETTSEITTHNYTEQYNSDSLTDFINELSDELYNYTQSQVPEGYYEIWKEDSEGNLYKTIEPYETTTEPNT